MTIPALPANRPQYPAYRKHLARAAKSARRLEGRIQQAVKDGKIHKAKQLQRIYLRSEAARSSALIDAHKRASPAHRLPHRELPCLARDLDPRSPAGEPFVIFTKMKPGRTDARVIRSYGPSHQAKQILTRRAMRPFCHIDPRAFLHRGRDTAVSSLLEAINEQDWRWVTELDIRNFYPSIDRDQLANFLPIDRETFDATIVTEGALWRLSATRSPCTERPELYVTTAFRGLPQGAITSPLVADVYITRLLSGLPQDFFCVNYGDNFYVGARTRRELIQKIRTLEEVLHLGSQGRLAIVRKQGFRRIDWGFECLGYRIKIVGGMPEIGPTGANSRRFALRAILMARSSNGPRASRRFLNFARSWRSSFKLWPQGDMECARLIHRISSISLLTISVTGAAAMHSGGAYFDP